MLDNLVLEKKESSKYSNFNKYTIKNSKRSSHIFKKSDYADISIIE